MSQVLYVGDDIIMWPLTSFYHGHRSGQGRNAWGSLICGILAIWGSGVFCFSAESLPDFDRRYDAIRGPAKLSQQREGAHKLIQQRVPGIKADFDPLLGTPAWIRARHGFLSGPRGEGKAISREAARAFSGKDPDQPIKAMLQEHRKLYGHGPEVLVSARTTRDYISADDGTRTVYWEQQLDGIPVYLAKLGAHVTAQGELVSISSTFVPDVERAATAGMPRRKFLQLSPDVTARKALLAAIASIQENVAEEAIVQTAGPVNAPHPDPLPIGWGEGEQLHVFKAGNLPGAAQASLVWLPMNGERLRLCWAVDVIRRERGERFKVLVDAENGAVLLRRCLTFDISEVSYRVFTGESPSPLAPTWPVPSRAQPPLVAREMVTLSALDTNASPLGWIDDGRNETRGNNVDARLDVDADNLPDLPRVQGTSHRVFDYPLDLSQSPTNFGPAATVQLFYWCNWMHDRLYQVGFTERLGNFQKDNFGRGGYGGDPVIADAQDGSGVNNANFTPASDGASPRIQMYLFNGPNPWRDASLDASVILHEYTHGMTDRQVAGGGGINSGYQPYGLHEGWSDFVAQALLSKPEDDPDGVYACGGYSTYMWLGLQENYYFGIRRYPYTTDMSKNPLTFRHIYYDDVPDHPEIPRNPTITSTGLESHRMGEVWCTVLWEARANLIRKLGYEQGNEAILKLVRRGQELLDRQNPNFLDARDAIFDADRDLYQSTNSAALWAAFAKRGMGVDAETSEIPYVSMSVTQSFDLPPPLNVFFPGNFTPVVQRGAPFTPISTNCGLQNRGENEVVWSVQSDASWLSFEPAAGRLGSMGITNLIIIVNSNALDFSEGAYSNAVLFVDQTASETVTQWVTLLVVGPTAVLNNGMAQINFPRDYYSYTFTPETNSHLYTVCQYPAAGFPTDPAGGQELIFQDDSYWLVTLTNGAEITILGVRTNKLLIGSNGEAALNAPYGYATNTIPDYYLGDSYHGNFFEVLRAAVLYTDLNPGTNVPNRISWKQLSNSVAITYENVPEYSYTNHLNNFQIELFFDGVIRFTYCGVMTTNGIWIGFSRGLDPSFPYHVTDLSTNPSCYGVQLNLPSPVAEGVSPLTGLLTLIQPVEEDTVFDLQSSNTNLVQVSPTLTLLEGQVSAPFALSVQDDALINGTRSVTITARGGDYDPISGTLEVHDDEIATLSLTVTSNVIEGAGLLAGAGQVTLNPAPDAPINVRLSSDNTNWVQVPNFVTVPSGQTLASFDLLIPDDLEINTTRTVLVQASVGSWTPASQAISVQDNESRQLVVVLPERFMQTSSTHFKAGRVDISGMLPTNLLVNLVSKATNLLQVPSAVWLPAGVRAVYFDVTIIDLLQTNDLSVSVEASAAGFVAGSGSTLVGGIASPSAPIAPSPPDRAVRVSMAGASLSWGTAQPEWPGSVQFEVYFGTNSVPGTAQFQGLTSGTNWPLPALSFGATYFWQVIATRGTNRVPGAVWRFTTVGMSHFEVSSVGPQRMGVPFPVTITAKDENLQTAADFAGPATLRGLASAVTDSIVITEVDTGNNDQVEFANVSDHSIEISGWQVALYDWVSWPEPKTIYTIRGRVMCPASNVFVLQRSSATVFPGAYPRFLLGTNLSWNITGAGNPLAVLLRDQTGKIIDFMCGMDAAPAQITNPVAIPPEHWLGNPVPPNLATTRSLQRRGGGDHNHASDWTIATTNMAARNPSLTLPFAGQRPVALSPSLLSNFAGGIWSGQVTIGEAASYVALEVEDGQGHFGTNAPFAVMVLDDLSLQVRPPSYVPRLNGPNYTYTLTVSNTGPAASTGVFLQDRLPPSANLVSVIPSQGNCNTNADGSVLCNLDRLDAASSCSVIITVRPTAVGNLTNYAVVWRAEDEVTLQNNSAQTVTAVEYPWLTIGNINRSEGSLSNVFSFPVNLSDTVSVSVTVHYYTSNGTAQAGVEYVPAAGALTFPSGILSNNIAVTVFGNQVMDSNKTFFVYLDQPSNAIIAINPGRGTILNDDFSLSGSLSISNAAVLEGEDGLANAVFTVSLPGALPRPASVYYYTIDGTATAGLDYLPTWGRLDLPAGVTNASISVTVLGDRLFESNETFYVKLAYSEFLYIARPLGTGTILDDDAALLHHFGWTVSGTNQIVNAPFSASIYAMDGANRPVTNFNGRVALRAGRQSQEIGIGSGTNLLEYPFGAAFEDERLQVIYPATEIARPGRITGLALRLFSLPGQALNHWTIRMKHTALTNFQRSVAWEDFGGTTVFQANQPLASGGWVAFPLHNPFDYNGTNSLLVDFSFNNGDSSSDGLCFGTLTTNQSRALGLRTDSFFGDPLSWIGSLSPIPNSLMFTPNIKLTLDTPVGLGTAGLRSQLASSPSLGEVLLVNGIWTGQLSLQEPGSDVVLVAQDDEGHMGASSPLFLTDLRLTVERIGNDVRISFPTIWGQHYQIESAEQLMPLSWAPLSGIIVGAGEPYSFTNSISGSACRFYRVTLAP